jgi:hypothetical protein
MFYVIRKNRDGTEEIISKHRYKDIAEERCEKATERHRMFLGIGKFRTDGTEFYVKEK